MKAWFKGFALSLVLSLGLVSGIIYLDNQGFFNLQLLQVQFVETDQASKFPAMQRWKQDLKLQLEEWNGVSLWDLPMSEIASKVSPLDWVENFSVHRRFPNKLSIELAPKKWIALIQSKNVRKFQGLSRECEVLPEVRLLEAIDLPVIDALSINTKDKMNKACMYLNSLNSEGIVQASNVANLSWAKDGLLVDLMQPQTRLRMGSDLYFQRNKRIEKVLHYLEEKSLTPKVITSSFDQKVVVKLRKDR